MNNFKTYPKDAQESMLKVLQNEDLWPHWPYLTLKNPKDGQYEYAVLCSRDTDPELFPGGPYRLQKRLLFIPPNKDTEVLTYPTLEAMLEDGWVVD